MLDRGDRLPGFRLPDHDGTPRDLGDLKGSKGLVLYVYPKDDTPGCTIEAQDFRDRAADFAGAGYPVVGISRDGATSHCRFRDKYALPFPLLTDPDGAFLEAIGGIGEKTSYGKTSRGILRSTYVVEADGTLRAVYRNVRAQGHAERVLADLASGS